MATMASIVRQRCLTRRRVALLATRRGKEGKKEVKKLEPEAPIIGVGVGGEPSPVSNLSVNAFRGLGWGGCGSSNGYPGWWSSRAFHSSPCLHAMAVVSDNARLGKPSLRNSPRSMSSSEDEFTDDDIDELEDDDDDDDEDDLDDEVDLKLNLDDEDDIDESDIESDEENGGAKEYRRPENKPSHVSESLKRVPTDGKSKEGLEVAKIGIEKEIVDALARRSISRLFPIQGAVLEPAMEGRDLIGRAKTGTGKTLAFGIPILDHIIKENRSSKRASGRVPLALVLAPTRELAKQVEKEFRDSAPSLDMICVYGGTSINEQQQQLQSGVDVAVGTPGRIIDLLKRGSLRLGEVKFVVLDEADLMLQVGFAEDVEKILEHLPKKRQSMLFSATMPSWVKNISRKFLKDPVIIDLVGNDDRKLAEGIKLLSISSVTAARKSLLSDLITVHAKGGKTIVFTQTKREADEVAMALNRTNGCEALHGDITQLQRERTLSAFREGRFSVLVATDVAARGLDIPNVDLVIHYEIPKDSETFVHRSGRTGRAGKQGIAILMHTERHRRTLSTIEQDIGCKFQRVGPPSSEAIIKSSAEKAASVLEKVHQGLCETFLPTAEDLLKKHGSRALAAALAHLSGFTQPPTSHSLLTHQRGWMTLRLIRAKQSLSLSSTRSVMGALKEISPFVADKVDNLRLINDKSGAVFDLPEDTARELLAMKLTSGDQIETVKELPDLEEDAMMKDNYGTSFEGRQGFGGRRGGFGGSDDRGRGSYGSRSDRGGRPDRSSSFRGGGRGDRSSSSRDGGWGDRSSSFRDGGRDDRSSSFRDGGRGDRSKGFGDRSRGSSSSRFGGGGDRGGWRTKRD